MYLKDFVGQEHCKKNLQLLIDAAKKGRKLPHIGLYGPAGCGKTTLAAIIANELNTELVYINGAAITSPIVFRKPIARAVKNKGTNNKYIIVVDECHELPNKIQNNLLSVLEEPAILCTPVEKKIKLPNGQFLQKGDILKEKLPPNIVFIFATTDKGRLNAPLYSRLHPINIEEYNELEKEQIVCNKLQEHNISLEQSDYSLIGGISKNIRHLIKICDRIIDFSITKNIKKIEHDDIIEVIDILGIDKHGCDRTDQKYLGYVKDHGPVSLSNIARFLNVAEKEVKEKIEPYLIRKEWINITAKGRVITNNALLILFNKQSFKQEIIDLMIFED